MNSLLRSTPLIINLPVDTEASQEYFEQHLIDNETAFLEAIIIAERLANVPAIMASSILISVAVSSSSVIIGISLAQIEQWADGISEGEPYWFFSLRGGHALPYVPSSHSNIKEAAMALNSREMAKELNSLEEKQKDVAELQGKPTAKAYYLTSLRKLFHRVNVESIKEVLNDFMAELDDDAFYLDPEQKEILAKSIKQATNEG